MLQLQILSGKQAGAEFSASKFPVTVGRSASADLPLDEPGVWDQHFEIHFNHGNGLTLKVHPNALVAINQQPIQEAVLRNGDLISVGSMQLRFGLNPVKQRSLLVRELLTWCGLAALCALQVAIIFALIKKCM